MTLTVESCDFTGNTASHGSAIYLAQNLYLEPSSTIKDCNFISNSNDSSSGVIYLAFSAGFLEIY